MKHAIFEHLVAVQIGTGVACDLPGMVLADNGCRVLKIEPPGGDPLRTSMPAAFLTWNRGKQSVVADLRDSHGAARVADLIAHADVVIETLGPGVADRRGVGAAAMRARNPALVYCSVKGFGSTGRYAHLKAWEGVIAAKAGGFGPNLGPGHREGPIFFGMPRASVGAAHHALQGIAAALAVRESTGRGQFLETTLFQGLMTYDYFGTAVHQLVQRNPRRYGTRRTPAGVMGLLCSADGRWVVPTNRLKKEYDALLRAVEMTHTQDDPRWRMHAAHGEPPTTGDPARDRELWEMVIERFRGAPLSHWRPRMDAEDDLAAEWARTCEQGLDHPQVVHNGHVVQIDDPRVGRMRQVGPIALFTATPSRIDRPAPALDEHGPLQDLATRALPRDTGRPAPAHPLAGITIVELGHHYAMPYAITLVAALGARVIKVEPPEGDHMRDIVAIPEAGGHKVMDGKHSVIADARTPQGREVIYDLVRRADVFALGLRQPAADRMQMNEAAIRRINPDIVYFSATGYGDGGPFAGKAMHAGTAAAAVGAIARQAPAWLEPARAAGASREALAAIAARFGGGANNGDAAAAASAATALVLAILARRRFGGGQYVRTSMLVGNAYSYSDDFNAYAGKPAAIAPDEDQLGFDATYRLYRAAEGWVFLALPTAREWAAFCTLAAPALGTDPRFADAAARQRNDAVLARELDALFAGRTAAQWESSLAPAGIGCVAVAPGTASAFACEDPVVRDEGLVVQVEHPIFGSILRHGLPQRFSETPASLGTGCWAGEHTDAVLGWLGYDAERIAVLRASGACAPRRERVAP
ncbi:MAG: CaiB/BaiF CoA transferase family protein [Gammaproteobacteria bacterium]